LQLVALRFSGRTSGLFFRYLRTPSHAVVSEAMVRNMDSLGRIVIPIELRRTLGIEIADPLELLFDDSGEIIMLRKYRTMECLFCSSTEGLTYFKKYFICSSCLEVLSRNVVEVERVTTKQDVVPSKETATKEFFSNRKQNRSRDTLFRLAKVMEQHPAAAQKKWAELLGISQGRVSQLIQKLNDQVQKSSVKEEIAATEAVKDRYLESTKALEDQTEQAVRLQHRYKKTSELIKKLNEVMVVYPDEKQSTWAARIGVSPGRVSQLVRVIREAGNN
ncbi:hypothetical protein J7E73_32575, partial [Paenibacillus albidus]|uniref:AbrB/MazE/SpoVT family DNA-binding domain-containing protein n=1 Tax=Paenibacillus albidus TaxID=2041023 RepID=UPI001BE9F668